MAKPPPPAVPRRRLMALLGGAGTALAMPGIRVHSNAQGLDKISYNTNWRAQAEHGGFYYALANGLYRDHGLDADIRMGGPQLNMSQLLLGGAVDIIMSNSFDAIRYVEEKLPFLCIGAIDQKDAAVIISHPGVGNDRLEDLKGKTILVGGAGRASFWPFLKAKYGYTDAQIRPYTFNIQPFVADKLLSQQGLLSSEPYTIEKETGIKPVVHLIADQGFENYNTTFNTSRKLIAAKKDVVQRFIDASIKGWAGYLQGGLGWEKANALIRKANPEMTDDRIAHATKVMNERGIVTSGDAAMLGIGAMTNDRWQRFYETMTAAGVFPKGLDYKAAYTLDFVNKKVAL